MNKKPMPSITANMKIGNPQVFIFCLYQFIEQRTSKKIEDVEDVCAFLKTTQKKIASFQKTRKLPLAWFIKIAETKEGRKFLSSFKDDLPVNYLFLKIDEWESSSSSHSPPVEESLGEEVDIAADLIEATQHTSDNNSRDSKKRSNDMHSQDTTNNKSDAVENETNSQEKPETLDVTKLLGGSKKPKGEFVSRDQAGFVLDKILEQTKLSSDAALSRVLGEGSPRTVYLIRKGTNLLYIEDIIKIVASGQLLVSKDTFLSSLGLENYKFHNQQNDNKEGASETKKSPTQNPSPPDKKTDSSQMKLSEEIEQVIRIALLMTGSVNDTSVRKEFFLGCLVSRLSDYSIQIKSEGGEVAIKKEGFDFYLSLDAIPFAFKVE